MTDTLLDCIADIAGSCAAINGVKSAPTYAPDQIGSSNFPFVVTYPGTGTVDINTPNGNTPELIHLHSVIVELHVARSPLTQAISNSIGFAETIPNAIYADVTLGGNADTVGAIEYTFGGMKYGDLDTVGYRFTITGIKIRKIVT